MIDQVRKTLPLEPWMVTPNSSMCVKSDAPSRPGGCCCAKNTSRDGPSVARHTFTRRCNVRTWLLRAGLNFAFEIRSRSSSGSAILCELGVLFPGEVHEDPSASVEDRRKQRVAVRLIGQAIAPAYQRNEFCGRGQS